MDRLQEPTEPFVWCLSVACAYTILTAGWYVIVEQGSLSTELNSFDLGEQ